VTRQTSPVSVPTSTAPARAGSGATAWKIAGEGECAVASSWGGATFACGNRRSR
jgi:hypothetical protein